MAFFGVWNAQQKSISDIAKQLSNNDRLKLEYYGFNSEEQEEFDKKNNKLIKRIQKLNKDFTEQKMSLDQNTNNDAKNKVQALNWLINWCDLIEDIYTADRGWLSTQGGSQYYNLGNFIKNNFIKTVSNGSYKEIIEQANSVRNILKLLLEEESKKIYVYQHV